MSSFLVFNFDGTGNEPEDAVQEEHYKEKREDDNISNVLKLHFMMGGNLYKKGSPRYGKSIQSNINHCFYYQGIGTYGSWLQRAINGGIAPEFADVASVLRRAKADFKRCYTPGDTVLVTGFSRGAALARRFVGTVAKELVETNTPPFVFMCVFDTVTSIGLPDLNTNNRPDDAVVFEDGNTVSAIVKKATHMLSLDDKRRAFQPTLMNHDPDRILELWFAGAHSDVGGGYYRDGLSDLSLSHAMKWLGFMSRTQGMPEIDFHMPSQEEIDSVCPASLKGMIGIDDLQRNPNPLGKNHQQDRWPVIDWLTLYDRICCVNVNDKPSKNEFPIIHHAITERLYRDDDYRPKSLANTKHYVWHDFVNPPVFCHHYNAHIHYHDVNWMDMAVGDSQTRIVDADQFNNFTGIYVEKDEMYRITVDDKDLWHDGEHISCDADGWSVHDVELGPTELFIRMARSRRRVPDSKWFRLCASVNSSTEDAKALNENAKGVGQSGDFVAHTSGELVLFANDLKSKYGNNSGSLLVTITRVR